MKKESILITGARGGLASELSKQLCDRYNLVGIDPRSATTAHPFFGEYHKSHYRSRKVDEVFRSHKPKAFFHLGRIPATSSMKRSDRYSENVLGTEHLFNLCAEHEVPTVCVLSTFHVYGAHPHNPLYLKEMDSLRATQRIPELSDAMELDHLASRFSLTFKGDVVVLRPTNIVGPLIANTLTKLLRLSWLPVPLGFDPPVQLIHQKDLVKALICILNKPQRGIFNLAGPGSLPLSSMLEVKKIKTAPLPDILIRSFLKHIPLPSLRIPDYMVDFFKFPTLIDSTAFSKAYDFNYDYTLIDSLSDI